MAIVKNKRPTHSSKPWTRRQIDAANKTARAGNQLAAFVEGAVGAMRRAGIPKSRIAPLERAVTEFYLADDERRALDLESEVSR